MKMGRSLQTHPSCFIGYKLRNTRLNPNDFKNRFTYYKLVIDFFHGLFYREPPLPQHLYQPR